MKPISEISFVKYDYTKEKKAKNRKLTFHEAQDDTRAHQLKKFGQVKDYKTFMRL